MALPPWTLAEGFTPKRKASAVPELEFRVERVNEFSFNEIKATEKEIVIV